MSTKARHHQLQTAGADSQLCRVHFAATSSKSESLLYDQAAQAQACYSMQVEFDLALQL